MKSGLKKFVSVGIVAVTFHSISQADENPAPARTNSNEKLSYSVGMNIGTSLKRAGIEVDPKIVGDAIADVLKGSQLKYTDKEAQETITAYQQEIQAKRQKERLQLAEKNNKEAEAFLTANKSKEGVKVQDVELPNGGKAELQYKVISEGSGESPKPEDNVTFNYRMTTLDGKEIDSSAKHGQPIKTVLNNFSIRGVKEALQQMKAGGKRELFIPPSLAFEDRGAAPNIEPGAGLIFEVELVGFEAPQPPQPLTSDIIMVPSAEQMKAGSNIMTIKPEEVKRIQQSQTNSATGQK